jgi:50S ribosomal subunit-associated GTPase HflX
VGVSAQRGINISTLQEIMLEMGDERHETLRLLMPYSAMRELAQIYRTGTVLERKDGDDGITLTARLTTDEARGFRAWVVEA